MGEELSIKNPKIMGLIIDPNDSAMRNKEATNPVTGKMDSSVHAKTNGKIMDIANPTTPDEIQIPS